jgi:preprotein translocase subunit SecE
MQGSDQVADASSNKFGDIIRNVPEFVQQVQAERRKVAWPTRRETVTTAIMVVLLTLILGIFFFAVDSVFSQIVKALLSTLS